MDSTHQLHIHSPRELTNLSNHRPLVPEKPAITYRRTKSLGDYLIKSEFKEDRGDPCKHLGTFSCGGCGYCQFLWSGTKKIRLPNGTLFVPKHYANCRTMGVVYLLTCECGSFYVGKTIQEFWKRMYRHIHSMRKCDPDLPLGRHVTSIHAGSFPRIKFLVLDRVHPPQRGGDWDKRLMQIESRWIFYLGATSPPGLNDSLSFKPFLDGFVSGGWER